MGERKIWPLVLCFALLLTSAGCARGSAIQPTVPPLPTGHTLAPPTPVVIGQRYEDFGITVTPLRYQQQVTEQQACYSYLCQKPDLHYSGLEYTVQNATTSDLAIVLCYEGMNPGVSESGPPEVIDTRDYALDPTFPRTLIQFLMGAPSATPPIICKKFPTTPPMASPSVRPTIIQEFRRHHPAIVNSLFH